jgi:hypothetical protein
MTQSSEHYPPSADSIVIAGDAVTLCFGVEPERSCWRVDVATKAFTPLPVTAPREGPPPARVDVHDNGTVRLCGPRGSPCKVIANPHLTKESEWLGVSDDLATVAITDSATLYLYDVAGTRVRATIPGWPDSPMHGDAFHYAPTFATRDRMIVWYAWSPVSEQGRIFDMAGKQLAIVGTDFMSLDPDKSSWRVHGAEWAIKGEGNDLLTVDVNDPRVTSTYALAPLLALPRPPRDSDVGIVDVLAVAGTAKRLIVVTGENPVTIGVLDRTTTKLEKLDPPRCPPRQ